MFIKIKVTLLSYHILLLKNDYVGCKPLTFSLPQFIIGQPSFINPKHLTLFHVPEMCQGLG